MHSLPPTARHRPVFRNAQTGWLLLFLAAWTSTAPAQIDIDQPPINYLSGQPNDPVVRLQAQLNAGEVELKHDQRLGYLPAVLSALHVPATSQALVFSKTSFQLRRISPRTPRAIYFNDEVYVGWVRGSGVMELSTVDPELGANFYTLVKDESGQPQFQRKTYQCLQCHGSSMTNDVPGHVVRSVYSGKDGQPILGWGTYLTTQQSPLEQRWGGWYVTGTHGDQYHLGNLTVSHSGDPRKADLTPGANVTDLSVYFRTAGYLTSHSDIVALMVLEHQTTMQNLLTRANFLTRVALRDKTVMDRVLERPKGFQSDSTKRRIQKAAEPLVKYMLFAGEARLTDPIVGSTEFAGEFADRGPRDDQGRSLRELDLQERLFKYPCSYLIYSELFKQLPRPVKDQVHERLWEVLTGKDTSEDFEHLSTTLRREILEILLATKTDLPDYWKGRDE